MLWIAWAVALAAARTEKKTSAGTANNQRMELIECVSETS